MTLLFVIGILLGIVTPQTDSLVNLCRQQQNPMTHTENYIHQLIEKVDVKDTASTIELQEAITIVQGINSLDKVCSEAKQKIELVYELEAARHTLNSMYNREQVRRQKKILPELPTQTLTEEEKNYINELYNQLDLYFLATYNMLQVIEDIWSAKQNPETFSEQITNAVILFADRNDNINNIPYMKRLYDELKGYLHRNDDGSFDVQNVQWEDIDAIKLTLEYCRKK